EFRRLGARCLLVPRSNNREMLFIRTRPDFDSLHPDLLTADLGDSAPVSFEPEPSEAESETELRSKHRRAGQLRICSASVTAWKYVLASGGLEFGLVQP
ncbi:MAG: hypothetical protein MUF54_04750, partial [Polyangiaceae bacterium]|nr:hypothetical protein [Polyangiaceae bacterium]